MKNVISSFPRDLRPLIETGWGLIIKSHKLKSQVFFCSRDLPTKLEVVVAYEKGSPPTVVTLHKSRVKKKSYTWLMTTKIDKVMAYGIGPSCTKLHYVSITSLYVVS